MVTPIKTIKCCEIFDCYKEGWRSLQLAPGTLVLLCETHYKEEYKEKFGEDYDT
jgi:hypothetical protein|tara:strand:+ start:3945 stop:4106 length:162 start_codon:yes stop_codon:yes gene_type:complete